MLIYGWRSTSWYVSVSREHSQRYGLWRSAGTRAITKINDNPNGEKKNKINTGLQHLGIRRRGCVRRTGRGTQTAVTVNERRECGKPFESPKPRRTVPKKTVRVSVYTYLFVSLAFSYWLRFTTMVCSCEGSVLLYWARRVLILWLRLWTIYKDGTRSGVV